MNSKCQTQDGVGVSGTITETPQVGYPNDWRFELRELHVNRITTPRVIVGQFLVYSPDDPRPWVTNLTANRFVLVHTLAERVLSPQSVKVTVEPYDLLDAYSEFGDKWKLYQFDDVQIKDLHDYKRLLNHDLKPLCLPRAIFCHELMTGFWMAVRPECVSIVSLHLDVS